MCPEGSQSPILELEIVVFIFSLWSSLPMSSLKERSHSKGYFMRSTFTKLSILTIVAVASIGIGQKAFAQAELDEFELDTETSFFEAENTKKQLEISQQALEAEQMEAREAEERAKEIASKAKEVRERTEKQRVEIEKRRAALKKERQSYQSKIDQKSSEIKALNKKIVKEKKDLAGLVHEVRQLKAKNRAYDRQIAKAKEARKKLRAYTAKTKAYESQHRKNLANRKRILNQVAYREKSSLGRSPASVEDPNLNVRLRSKNSK
tara:strand:- start:1544 stop:2335 length:792 start_codon:yes stop_codon:yes gene_type:complete